MRQIQTKSNSKWTNVQPVVVAASGSGNGDPDAPPVIGDVIFEITSEDSGNEDDISDVQSVKQDIEIAGWARFLSATVFFG